jgi:serine/threonine protein phosphatase PrpC
LEKIRIIEAGGRVEPFQETGGQFIGPDRVWLQHEQLPGLAMSRSMGDLVAAHVGVIAEPEVIIHELTSLDKFLVVASDGVWEFISSQHCVRIISEFYQDNNIEKACEALMAEAINNWNKEDNVVDDITFVVLFFNDKFL